MHRVERLVDVRRWPRSRRHPQFNGPALAAALVDAGLSYTHEEALGGMRGDSDAARHAGLPKDFRGYGAHMESADFAAALERVRVVARDARVALMCAEADPGQCHRSLIADALEALGASVWHIIDAESPTRHTTTPGALVTEGRVSYPACQRRLDLS